MIHDLDFGYIWEDNPTPQIIQAESLIFHTSRTISCTFCITWSKILLALPRALYIHTWLVAQLDCHVSISTGYYPENRGI